MTLDDRIKAYLDATPPCIAGQGGDEHLFKVACVLYNGWALDQNEVYGWLKYFNQKCEPPWDDGRLMYKTAQAVNATHTKPHGHFLGSEMSAPKPAPASVRERDENPISTYKMPRTAATAKTLVPAHLTISPPSPTIPSGIQHFTRVCQENASQPYLNTGATPNIREAQLAELAKQGATDLDFLSKIMDTFEAKPKRKGQMPDIKLSAKERKKLNVRSCIFSANYIADYPWAMWETLAIYDPQWSGK